MFYRQRVKMLVHGRLRSMTNLERVVHGRLRSMTNLERVVKMGRVA
jgi:hypothetical protein